MGENFDCFEIPTMPKELVKQKMPGKTRFLKVIASNLPVNEKVNLLRYIDWVQFPAMKNIPDKITGDTALHIAIEHSVGKDAKILVEFLVGELDMKVKAVNNKGENCLFSAVKGGKIVIMKYLLEHDRSLLKTVDKDGNNALLLAARYANNANAVKMLVQKYKMDVKFEGQFGYNAFLNAARAGNDETLRFLVGQDSNVIKSTDAKGNSALIIASQYGNKASVEYLVKNVNMNLKQTGAGGWNCFLAAAAGGQIKTMRYLNSKDRTLKNAQTSAGDNVLVVAIHFSNKKTVNFLRNELNLKRLEKFLSPTWKKKLQKKIQ